MRSPYGPQVASNTLHSSGAPVSYWTSPSGATASACSWPSSAAVSDWWQDSAVRRESGLQAMSPAAARDGGARRRGGGGGGGGGRGGGAGGGGQRGGAGAGRPPPPPPPP